MSVRSCKLKDGDAVLTLSESTFEEEIEISSSTSTDYNNNNSMIRLEQGSKNNLTIADLEVLDQQREAFAVGESKAVVSLRIAVFTVLILSALGVALGVYFDTSIKESQAFETQFVEDANKVLTTVADNIGLTLGTVDSFVCSMVSYANYSNSTWPFVTLPHFAVHASKILRLSNAVYFNVYPLIKTEQRKDWEKYSTENDAWVEEAIALQEKNDEYFGPIIKDYEVSNEISDGTGPVTNRDGPYLPAWQSSPVIPRYCPYNWDLMSFLDKRSIFKILESHKIIISAAYLLPNLDDPVAVTENFYLVDWFKDFIRPNEDPSEPVSDWFYPILDNVEDVRIDDPVNEALVGILSMSVYWRDTLKDILPRGKSNSVVVVFENECNPTFTYQLNGPAVKYLGRGDLHNMKYNHMKISTNVSILESTSVLMGVPLDQDFCPFRLHVYPSNKMNDHFLTTNPTVFTVCVVLIFLFTSLVFLTYDRLVAKRQRKMMYTAIKSKANVSMLGEMVKERTVTLETTARRLADANRNVVLASQAQLQHFACMGHEIRTPLNCIIGLSSLLGETELTPMQNDSICMIINSGELLLRVVNDVLDYSKLESGNVDIEIRRVNLQETLDSVIHLIEMKGQTMKLTLRTEFDARIGAYISTDSRRLQQIMYNLLGNALKFSKEGGIVELNISLHSNVSIPERRRPNSYSPDDDKCEKKAVVKGNRQYIRFLVKDYGQGIAKRDLRKIFQPFLQASIETERVYGGSGLGLAIVTKLVHGLGGTILVESEEGGWSEFSILIPYEESPADIQVISADLNNATIILVGNDKETFGQMSDICVQFKVDFINFLSMKEMGAYLAARGDAFQDRIYVCLLHESLYESQVYKGASHDSKSILLTYGLNYGVEESIGHYRSLTHIIPFVLMKSISVHVKQSGRPKFTRHQSTQLTNTKSYREWHILVAEDNVVNQKVISRILSRLGVNDVEVVDNGQKAVDREKEHPFDVILMDMQMPVMDGIDACQHIASRKDGHPKAKVVFVTAHASSSFEAQCLKAGAVSYLTKPCTIRMLEDCLQKLANSNP